MGNSLAVQWSDSSLSLPRAQVQSLVRELRSHQLRDIAEKKKKKIIMVMPPKKIKRHTEKWKKNQNIYNWRGVNVLIHNKQFWIDKKMNSMIEKYTSKQITHTVKQTDKNIWNQRDEKKFNIASYFLKFLLLVIAN